MKLIVGLGNPGSKYLMTRHNAGFIMIDNYLHQRKEKLLYKERFLGEIGIFKDRKEDYIILKPSTYMNASGDAIKKVMNYYDIDVSDILVFVDDIYIDFGYLRLREKGSHGGQNGLRHIIDRLNTNLFKRVRIGISAPHKMPLDKYVLSDFKSSEIEMLKDLMIQTEKIIEMFVDGEPFVDIMTTFNKKKTEA